MESQPKNPEIRINPENLTHVILTCSNPYHAGYFHVLCSIDPDKEILLAKNRNFFLTHQFKHVIWVLKRTVSLRRLF